MKTIVNILFTIGFLFAQQIDWNSKPSPITAIEIYCDTEGIPIYVDGIKNKLFVKNLTYAPLEKDLIEEKLLNKAEKDYILKYHLETYSKISPFLNEKERKWLAKLI